MSETQENPGGALEVRVYGLVQGVGFRPFLHRLAAEHRITGWAQNTEEGVCLKIQGQEGQLEAFLAALSERHPPLARVERVVRQPAEREPLEEFRILPSRDSAGNASRISPDIAVCGDCLADIFGEGRRRHYPFTNCTNCGPRFSIVRGLPYDRAATTMSVFPMCPDCRREYEDITDRRYHAQPNACPRCGPRYRWVWSRDADNAATGDAGGNPIATGAEKIDLLLGRAAQLIGEGGILALKGIGGFHLVCNAADEEAVRRLRRRKRREGKPFAVMARSLRAARAAVRIDAEEERLLSSLARPIVLCRSRGEGGPGQAAPAVSRGLHSLGVMLPYAPIHHLLFSRLSADLLVMTSGNLSGRPLIYENGAALQSLAGVADAFLLYDREIRNPCDDSVALVAGGRRRLLRRSRGMVPDPLPLDLPAEGIVAGGGELKSCFALGREEGAVLSQHIGDLKDYDTLLAYRRALSSLMQMLRLSPQLAAADLHPDYASGREMRGLGVPVVRVQHHHAHIASCLAEHRTEERVIGIAFDGTGYGDDGAVWGGEFLLCDLLGYRRLLHFDYLPLPGGDRAAEEPWRMALSWLRRAYPAGRARQLAVQLCGVSGEQAAALLQVIDSGTASPPTSSAGRLFDAAAALLGLVEVNEFEAEAPMRLEALAACHRGKTAADEPASGEEPAAASVPWYPFRVEETVRTEETVRALVEDLQAGTEKSLAALKFHRTVAEIAAAGAERIREEHGVSTAALSGGVFQNAILLEMTRQRLHAAGFRVLSHSAVPANDGGIALGQLAVAAARRRGADFRRGADVGADVNEEKQRGDAERGGAYVSRNTG